MASRCGRLVAGGALAVSLAAGLGSAAFAKGDGLPLNVRIVGAAGQRNIEFVTSGDLDGALAFNSQVADLEQMATTLVFGPGGPASRTPPGLTNFYEIDFTQQLATDRFPWNGMNNPHFYFYPTDGSIPAYVRLHVTRGSQPAVDGWLLARPEFTALVAAQLNGLTPIQPAPQPPVYPVAWWWLAPLLVLVGASVLLHRRLAPRSAS